MGLALVVIEEHAGRAVHLGDDHTLGTVHDERAIRGHQGHVAHEDVLFLDVLDRFRAGVFVDIEHDQAQRDLQRRRIGHVALLAFLDIVFRVFKLVLHELKNSGFVEILDRENRLENPHDPFAVRRLGLLARIQEKVIGRFLNLDKVRHFQHFADFAVVFTQTFLAEIRRRHGYRNLVFITVDGRAGNRAWTRYGFPSFQYLGRLPKRPSRNRQQPRQSGTYPALRG